MAEEARVFSLPDLFAQCAFDWAAKTRGKGLALVSHTGEFPRGSFRGWPRRVRAVLDILLHNAVRFTEDGSVLLECRAGPLEGNRLEATIRVADTGSGFSNEQSHLMLSEPGLAMVRDHVAAMGGHFTINGTPEHGTQVTMTIPLSLAPAGNVVIDVGPSPTRSGLTGMLSGRAHTVAAEAIVAAGSNNSATNLSDGVPATPPGARRARLLLVDGARMSQTVVSALLLRSGFRLDVVDSTAAALAATEAEAYDLILLDMRLEDVGGIETAKRIRAQGGRSHDIPILALSHDDDKNPEIEGIAQSAGINAVIARPTERGGFIEAVQRALEGTDANKRRAIG